MDQEHNDLLLNLKYDLKIFNKKEYHILYSNIENQLLILTQTSWIYLE
jgi:hypothetical protein